MVNKEQRREEGRGPPYTGGLLNGTLFTTWYFCQVKYHQWLTVITERPFSLAGPATYFRFAPLLPLASHHNGYFDTAAM